MRTISVPGRAGGARQGGCSWLTPPVTSPRLAPDGLILCYYVSANARVARPRPTLCDSVQPHLGRSRGQPTRTAVTAGEEGGQISRETAHGKRDTGDGRRLARGGAEEGRSGRARVPSQMAHDDAVLVLERPGHHAASGSCCSVDLRSSVGCVQRHLLF